MPDTTLTVTEAVGRKPRELSAKTGRPVGEVLERAIGETNRRREVQLRYNAEHGITPRTVRSAIQSVLEDEIEAHQLAQEVAGKGGEDYVTEEFLEALQAEMLEAAQNLEFERAALLRDKLAQLRGETVATPQAKGRRGRGAWKKR